MYKFTIQECFLNEYLYERSKKRNSSKNKKNRMMTENEIEYGCFEDILQEEMDLLEYQF